MLRIIINIWVGVGLGPGPVGGPWSKEKRKLGALTILQSTPRCFRVPPQRVSLTELDLHKMHDSTLRSSKASQRTILHLWEV